MVYVPLAKGRNAIAKKNLIIDNKFPRQKTDKLNDYKRDLLDISKRLVIVHGLPSTGKTKNATESAVEQRYLYDSIVLVRRANPLECGLLQGSLQDKMYIYTAQVEEYIQRCTQATVPLIILPVDALKGRRFSNSFVIIDEAEDIPIEDTFAIMSRMGENCKYVIIGDTTRGQQHKKIKDKSMLHYLVEKFKGNIDERVALHEFNDKENDILGDDFTKYIIRMIIDDFS